MKNAIAMLLIDVHAHLDLIEEEELAAVIERAAAAGVKGKAAAACLAAERGGRSEPAHVALTVREIARIA